MAHNHLLIPTLKSMAQPVRLHILEILHQGPVCVCDLTQLTGRRQPHVSQQLGYCGRPGWWTLRARTSKTCTA